MRTLKLNNVEPTPEVIAQINALNGVNNCMLDGSNLKIELQEEIDISQILTQISVLFEGMSAVTTDFPIEGLSCGGCASSATRLLNNQDGVIIATVEYGVNKASITYDASKTNPQKLNEALSMLGYSLTI